MIVTSIFVPADLAFTKAVLKKKFPYLIGGIRVKQ